MTDKEAFLTICRQTIKRDGIDNLLEWLETTDFFTAPASTRFHGNFAGGLCRHSLNVYEVLHRLLVVFAEKDINISVETLSVVTLFHDICKVNFYKKGTRNVKDPDTGRWLVKEIWEIDDKIPLGHGEKSCILLQQFMKLNPEELLAIRWHMGGFDSAVKGGDYSLSNAQNHSKLVSLLHAADLIASNVME